MTTVREWKKEEWTKEVDPTQQYHEVCIASCFHKWRNSVSEGENEDAKIKGESDEDEDLGHKSDFQEHEDNSFSIRKNKQNEYNDRFTQFQERVGDRVHATYTASLH